MPKASNLTRKRWAKRGRRLANLRQHAHQKFEHNAIAFARNPMRNLARDLMAQGFRQRQPVGRGAPSGSRNHPGDGSPWRSFR
jgi:hypothetical protein